MSGLKIVLNTTFTDPNLPILPTYDPIESAGSLALIDFSNPYGQDVVGVVPSAVNNPINNILWAKAAAMIGSGTKNTLAAKVLSSNFNGGEGLIEFSSKKGLHSIVSQTTNVDGHAYAIGLPDLIKTYILNNPTHKFFVSIWTRRTRIALTVSDITNVALSYVGNTSQTTGNSLYAFTVREDYPIAANARRLGWRDSAVNSLGTNIKNFGVDGYGGTLPANIASMVAVPFKVGSYSAFSGFEVNKGSSDILYKYYLEDLTVSGLTYAQRDTLDLSLYNEAFGVGGRFYNDTYTNPSTIA